MRADECGGVHRLDAVEFQLRLAQDVAGLGMWAWDARTGAIRWDRLDHLRIEVRYQPAASSRRWAATGTTPS